MAADESAEPSRRCGLKTLRELLYGAVVRIDATAPLGAQLLFEGLALRALAQG